jgi:hypothetical protein
MSNLDRNTSMTTAVQISLPEELLKQAQRFVEDGWAGQLDDLLAEALRRYLESHGPTLTESFIRDDVAWGLHGDS